MNWFKRLWDRLGWSFSDCNTDLMVAAGTMMDFPRDFLFSPQLRGFGFRDKFYQWVYDAPSYLAVSGRFVHLGLNMRDHGGYQVPFWRYFSMNDAVRRAFRLSFAEFNYLFSPDAYREEMTPQAVAHRLERFAADRKIP